MLPPQKQTEKDNNKYANIHCRLFAKTFRFRREQAPYNRRLFPPQGVGSRRLRTVGINRFRFLSNGQFLEAFPLGEWWQSRKRLMDEASACLSLCLARGKIGKPITRSGCLQHKLSPIGEPRSNFPPKTPSTVRFRSRSPSPKEEVKVTFHRKNFIEKTC